MIKSSHWREALPPVHPELRIRSSPLIPGAEALRSTGSDKRKRFPIGCGANELERHRRRHSAGRSAPPFSSFPRAKRFPGPGFLGRRVFFVDQPKRFASLQRAAWAYSLPAKRFPRQARKTKSAFQTEALPSTGPARRKRFTPGRGQLIPNALESARPDRSASLLNEPAPVIAQRVKRFPIGSQENGSSAF